MFRRGVFNEEPKCPAGTAACARIGRRLTGRVLLAVLLATGRAWAADWPHWRGPGRDDIVAENLGWKDGHWISRTPLWQTDVGEGSTSPLVVDGRVYVMGWADGEDHIRCLESNTGKPLWQASYKCPEYGRHAVGDESVYAGPTATPEYDPQTKYLFTLSCDGDLNCWDTRDTGKKVWGINLYDRFHVARRPASGTTATPPPHSSTATRCWSRSALIPVR